MAAYSAISAFDSPYTINKISVTPGYTDQTFGDYVASFETSINITGHVQDITAKELQRLPKGEYNIGDRKLYTGDDVKPGDRIQITESDGTTTEWEVRAQERNYSLLSKMGISRKSYLLKRKI